MPAIPFTQYIRPDGRQRDITIDVAPELKEKADAILSSGRYRFEAEELSTGEASLTCADMEKEEDIAIEVVRNAPGTVRPGVDRLIDTAHKLIMETGE